MSIRFLAKLDMLPPPPLNITVHLPENYGIKNVQLEDKHLAFIVERTGRIISVDAQWESSRLVCSPKFIITKDARFFGAYNKATLVVVARVFDDTGTKSIFRADIILDFSPEYADYLNERSQYICYCGR